MLIESKEIKICYFDLREYAFIVENYSKEEQINVLQRYHQIIEQICRENNGILYQMHIDTAIYFFDPDIPHFIRLLQKIKFSVDEYLKSLGAPSLIHISSVQGKADFGEIQLSGKKYINIYGTIMNDLQKTISYSESNDGIYANDKIVLDNSYRNEVMIETNVKEVIRNGKTFFILR